MIWRSLTALTNLLKSILQFKADRTLVLILEICMVVMVAVTAFDLLASNKQSLKELGVAIYFTFRLATTLYQLIKLQKVNCSNNRPVKKIISNQVIRATLFNSLFKEEQEVIVLQSRFKLKL
jgi:hypothetical protein